MSVTPLLAPSNLTVQFLDDLHSLTKAFSPHEKRVSYSLKTTDEVLKLIEQCVSVIENNIDHIRHDRNIALKKFKWTWRKRLSSHR